MKSTIVASSFVCVLILMQSQPLSASIPDIIFFNGKIITVDEDFSIAQAIAIAGERILKVGSDAEIMKLAGAQTSKFDLRGKSVLPGLIDAHAHPFGAARSELFESIPDVHSVRELLDYISAQTKVKKPGEWIIHPKMFATRLRELRPPTKSELDGIAPDNPVFLNGSYGGSINSCAMRMSGISRDTQHPGVLKDKKSGEPTGIIRASAFSLLKDRPENRLSHEQELDALHNMLRHYNRVGLTSVTDGMQNPARMRLYQDLWAQDRLPVRVCINIRAPRFESREQFAKILREWGFYSRFGNEHVRIGALKVVLDGGILTGTAYLREPWGSRAQEIYGIDDPQYRGVLNFDKKELYDIVAIAHSYGWKMSAHCTGGGAVDLLLDAYEHANRDGDVPARRCSIIHGNFFTPEAIERCRKLGVIADFQPAWFYKDADAMKNILGSERVKTFLPIKSMLAGGMIVNAGSDHMVKYDSYESINPYNPLLGMWTLLTRQTARGSTVHPAESITRKQALRMYTIYNAFGTFEEDIKGSLEPHKLADLIVVSKDILTCPVDMIREMTVELTMVGGKVVYRK